MIKLAPIGGLCNRLRQILSYRSEHGQIEVLWANSDAVSHGAFLDVFEPLDGVTFTYAGEIDGQDVAGADIVGYAQVSPGAKPGWEKGYAELRPKAHVIARVKELVAKLDPTWSPEAKRGPPSFNAIHVRRTDHADHAPKFGHSTSDQELLGWHRGRTRPLYLATDNPETVAFLERAAGPLVVNRVPEKVQGYEKRAGTLFDAAVDLFTCVEAWDFMGCWMSSFSETISLMRCGGAPKEGFNLRIHMPSADAEYYRGRADRAEEAIGIARGEH
jgi:hypothetical protein